MPKISYGGICPSVHQPTGARCDLWAGHDGLHSGCNGEPGNEFNWPSSQGAPASEAARPPEPLSGEDLSDAEGEVISSASRAILTLPVKARKRVANYLFDRFSE